MYFRVLGPVELSGQNGATVEIPAEKQRRLLAALLLRANTWVSSDYLVEAVWPDKPPKSTAGNVATYIHYLRDVVPAIDGDRRIDSRRGGYRLTVERHECDVTVFEDRVSAAIGMLAHAPPAVAATQLEAALELWRGDPYEPLTGPEVAAETERLTALLWHTRYALAKALLAAGRAGDAITLLYPLTASDPLREKTWEHLLTALSEDGRWAEVLVTYEKVRKILADELGIEPGPELRRLHLLALRADQAPITSTVDAVDNPTEVAGAYLGPAGNAVTAGRATRFPAQPRRWPWRHGVRTRSWAALVLIVVSAWLAPKILTAANHSPMPPEAGTPVLTFLAPHPGQVLQGVVTLRVKVSNLSRVGQVDFHRLTSRCPLGGNKLYIGMDTTPTATGEYEIIFDTRQASNGCLDIGAVALDRDNEQVLYPAEGTYVPITVNN